MAGIRVRYTRTRARAILPERQTHGSAGYDVFAANEQEIILNPGERAAIPTGIAVAVPEGYMLSVRPRSGLAIRKGFTQINSPGTIDSDYRGEIMILGVNLGAEPVQIAPGDRIAQFVLESVHSIDWVEESLDETERGEGGFGSTGRH